MSGPTEPLWKCGRAGQTAGRTKAERVRGARSGARSHRRAAPVAVQGVRGSDRVDIPHRMTRLLDFGDVPRYLHGIAEIDPGDGRLIHVALNDIARAYVVNRLAREPCPSRVGSYKALLATRNPTFSSGCTSRALGLKLTITIWGRSTRFDDHGVVYRIARAFPPRSCPGRPALVARARQDRAHR